MAATMADFLSQSPNTTLQYLCVRHKVPGKVLSRQQMLDGLMKRLADPEYLHEAVRALPRPLSLTLLSCSLASHLFSWTFQMQLDKLLGTSHKPCLTELEQLGFVWGGVVVTEPREAAIRVWLEEMARETSPPRHVIQADPTGPGVLRDVFALIGMAWRRELPLTKEKLLFKKAEEESLRRMEGSPALQGGGLQHLVLTYALSRGLLAEAKYDEKGRTGLIATELVWDWSTMAWSEIWTDMADFLLDGRSQWLVWAPELLRALRALPPDAWLPLQRLMDEYSALAGPGVDPDYLQLLLLSMVGLDLLVMGGDEGGEFKLQPSVALRNLCLGELPPLPAEEREFVVDATYAVTVPKTVPPEILCRLDRWCEERKADRVLTFKLLQASLRVAIEEGDRPAEIISFFERHTRGGLPPNVHFSLKEWMAGTRKARFEHLMLLRMDDADTAQLITGDKTLRKWVFGQITPTDLIIDASAVEKVRKRLGEMGVVTAPGIGRRGQADAGPRVIWQNRAVPDLVSPGEFQRKWMESEQ